MKLHPSTRIMVILFSFFCGTSTFAQETSPARFRSGLDIDISKTTEIMAAGYANLGSYIPANMTAEHVFNAGLQVQTAKSILEDAIDVRWARILLDERILAADNEKINMWTAGGIRTLQGEARFAYPLDRQFDFLCEDDDAPSKILGTKASLGTIKYLYGDPARTEKVDKKKIDIQWYDFIGFCTTGTR